MLHLIYGRSGYGKTFYAKVKLKELAEKNAQKVYFLVPEQASFDNEREILVSLGAENADKIKVVSFSKLSKIFFENCNIKRKLTISETGKTALMKLTLKDLGKRLEIYRKQISSPQFAQELIAFSSQLKRAGVSCDEFLNAAKQDEGFFSEKATEIALILTSFEQMLNSRYSNPDDDLTVMAEKLSEVAFFEGATVVVDSFRGFTTQQFKVLEKIISQAKDVFVTIDCDNMGTNETSHFYNVQKTANSLKDIAKDNLVSVAPPTYLTENHRAENDEMKLLERGFFADEKIKFEGHTDKINIYKAKNIYDEAEFVAKTIKHTVRTKGLRYRDFAVIARSADRYDSVLPSAFEKYAIPIFMDRRYEIADMAVFRFCISAFDIMMHNAQPDDVLMLLKNPISWVSLDEINALENYIFMWNLSSADLKKEFHHNPAGMKEDFSQTEKDSLSQLEQIRKKVMAPIQSLLYSANSDSAKGIATAIFNLIKTTDLAGNLKNYVDTLTDEGKLRYAKEQRRCYELLIDILDQLVLILEPVKTNLSDFYDLFLTALSLSTIGSVPSGLDQVVVGNAGRMRPGEPKITFIIGANDGVFPAPISSGGLLSDGEIQQLRSFDINLPDRATGEAIDERHLVYSSLCSAKEKLYVSYAISDLSGEELHPSEIVEEIKGIFPNHTQLYLDDEIESIASLKEKFAFSVAKEGKNSATYGAVLSEINEQSYNKLKDALLPIEDTITKESAIGLYGKDMYFSPSRVDKFYKCPFGYFCEYGLKVAPLREARLDSLQRGTLVHDVLENVFKDYTIDEMFELSETQIREYTNTRVFDYLYKTLGGKEFSGKEDYSYQNLCEMIAQLIVLIIDGFGSSKFRPFATELSLGGREDSVPPICYTLPDGSVLKLNGKVDRVDVFEEEGKKYIRIIDYKTGRKVFSIEDILVGQNLQMLVYLLMLHKGGEEIFGTTPIPAGVLYLPSRAASAEGNRKSGEEEIKSNTRKQLKMNGLIFEQSEGVLDAMERDAKGQFTPFSLKKSGDLTADSSVATAESYGIIMRHIEDLIYKMGISLHSGNVAISPTDGKDEDACKYCNFRAVCGKDENSPNNCTVSLSGKNLTRIEQAVDIMKEVQESGI